MIMDLTEALTRICDTIKRLISLYEEGKDPQVLDSLVYHLNRLRRILLPFENYTDIVGEFKYRYL